MSKQYLPDHFSARAKQAAEFLVSQRQLLLSGFGVSEFREKKNPNDVVTEIDLAVEKNLKQLFEQSGQILQGEEFGYDPSIDKPYWLCDPIDGTSCYVRGQEFCVSMIAYVDNDDVEIGLIYDFIRDKLYAAEKGKGAFCNSEPISVSDRGLDELKGCIFGDMSDPKFLKTLQHFKEDLHLQIYNVWSAGDEFVNLAAGKTEIKVGMPIANSDWDRAPGMLIFREAGGVYRRFDGSDASFHDKDFIAINSEDNYRQFIEYIKSLET